MEVPILASMPHPPVAGFPWKEMAVASEGSSTPSSGHWCALQRHCSMGLMVCDMVGDIEVQAVQYCALDKRRGKHKTQCK